MDGQSYPHVRFPRLFELPRLADHRHMSRTISPALHGLPFTSQQAHALGVTRAMLRGARFRKLLTNVYVLATLIMTQELWIRAALLILPSDAVISHVTALQMYGVDLGPKRILHFSTNTTAQTREDRLTLHRRKGTLTRYLHKGFWITGPDRTFVDTALQLGFVARVQAGDALLDAKATTYDALGDYLQRSHINGVRRARQAFQFVREGAESPMETMLRLMIVFARLPEPECNKNILDDLGRFIARGDLIYFPWKVVVEYDGWQHERDPKQRQRDRERLEALEAAGWRVIVVTSEDLKNKKQVVWRVHAALIARGCECHRPHFNIMWTRWFA